MRDRDVEFQVLRRRTQSDAWLCGKALAYMLSDAEDELAGWFPRMLRVTEERWKKAKLEEFLERKIG